MMNQVRKEAVRIKTLPGDVGGNAWGNTQTEWHITMLVQSSGSQKTKLHRVSIPPCLHSTLLGKNKFKKGKELN
jgi:hypothetical protein